MIKELKRLIFASLLIYIACIALMFLSQRHFIYFPQTPRTEAADFDFNGIIEPVLVRTSDDVSLTGWFAPPQGAHKKDKVILYFHGNATWPPAAFPKMLSYIESGYGVLFAEYRGYAGNPSSPNEKGLYKDADAYLRWLNDTGYFNAQIIAYGESLGSGVASELTLRNKFHALILETPFSTLPDAARHNMGFIPFLDVLMSDQYRSADKIKAITTPKLIMIAGRDEVIGSKTGLDLYAAAAEPKQLKIFEEAGHNSLYAYGADITVLDFLKDLE